jgi:two-component system, LuxR family, response regulator FixJ
MSATSTVQLATVHLVDDDPSFLLAQSRMLRAAGFPVSTFDSAARLLTCITPADRGCVVTDLWMPGMSGLELQAALYSKGSVLPIVFLTGNADIPSTVHAIRAGATDFLEKTASQESLLDAIRRALVSDANSHETRRQAVELRQRFSRLTPREREVLQHVVTGSMNKQIAARLDIHERTVKLHRTAITVKLGVHSTALLAVMARDAGFAAASRM